jgi:hypothetical protein
MGDLFKEFKDKFPMDFNPLSNFTQYSIMNREIYSNWCKSFCTPCLYRKIKKEGSQITPSEGSLTDFSKVDKYVLAYGTSAVIFDESESSSYIDFDVYFPIQNESFNKLNAQFTDNIQIQAPYDERFEYKSGDLVIFKFNEYIFRYEVRNEPESYQNIMYNLNIKYVDKKRISDLNQIPSEVLRLEDEVW